MKTLLLFLLMVNIVYSNDLLTFHIPSNAKIYFGVLKEETEKIPELIVPQYFGSLIEHETCISINPNNRYYKLCWNPKQQFKTKWKNNLPREQGSGLCMLTRAWRSDGSLRMDSLRDIYMKYPRQLKGLTWDTILDRPDLQIRAMLLLWMDNYNKMPDTISIGDKIAMADSAYNGGFGNLYKERSRCKLTKGCDQFVWFNNVEKINVRGDKKLYGNRSAFEINRSHVYDVIVNRLGKYVKFWDEYTN